MSEHDAREWRWGQHLSVLGPGKTEHETRIWGHWPTRVEDGDIFLKDAASGKIGRFEISNVRHTMDPPDMFFGTVVCVGYEDNEEVEQ